jgi:uncharacterized protein YjiS (DUF1127 family)
MKLIRTLKNMMASSYDRKASQQLHRMTDRELADIGICRGDITRICRTPSTFERYSV